MGVLSALPIINLGNLCCCLWVVGGGLAAAYLLQQNHPEPITPGDGALVGLLAGIAGAFVQFVVSIPVGLLMAPIERTMMQRAAEMAGTMPAPMREMIESYGVQRPGLGFLALLVIRLLGLFVALFLGGTFSTIGGLVGAVVFRRHMPAGTVDVSPSSPS
jgi:hypothetical protein